jgi:hypothetical protein
MSAHEGRTFALADGGTEMRIQDFELYHGALLTKLVRGDRPITIRMIETDADDCWSAYTIDDAVTIYTKASGHGCFREADKSVKWTFTFQSRHLAKLAELSQQHSTYVALVCANHRLPPRVPVTLGDPQVEWERWLDLENALRKKRTGICFLDPEEWRSLLDLDDDRTQSIAVQLGKRKAFVVNDNLRVPQNRIEKWEIPQHPEYSPLSSSRR